MVKALILLTTILLHSTEDVVQGCMVYSENPDEYPRWMHQAFGELHGPKSWYKCFKKDMKQLDAYYDWEALKRLPLGYNKCHGYQQSPIILRNWDKCEDDHRMVGKNVMRCNFDEIRHFTTGRSLRADYGPSCQAVIDFSTMPKFDISHMEVTTPSEHTVSLGPGKYKRYPAELVIYHTGRHTKWHGDFSKHMLNLVVFLEAGHESSRYYERYLQKWEQSLKLKYEDCGFGSPWEYESLCDLKDKIGAENERMFLKQMDGSEGNRNLEESFMEDLHDGIQNRMNTTTGINVRTHAGVGKPRTREIMPNYSIRHVNETQDTADSYPTMKRELKKYDSEDPYEHLVYKSFIRGRTYHRYQGSTTIPPCTERVEWRIMHEPHKISDDQLRRTNFLISAHVNDACYLGTVCRPSQSGECTVRCNRPLQVRKQHEVCNTYYFNKGPGRRRQLQRKRGSTKKNI